jgi:hypothetical protein
MGYRLYIPSLRINEWKLAASAGVDWCDYQKEDVTKMEILETQQQEFNVWAVDI